YKYLVKEQVGMRKGAATVAVNRRTGEVFRARSGSLHGAYQQIEQYLVQVYGAPNPNLQRNFLDCAESKACHLPGREDGDPRHWNYGAGGADLGDLDIFT